MTLNMMYYLLDCYTGEIETFENHNDLMSGFDQAVQKAKDSGKYEVSILGGYPDIWLENGCCLKGAVKGCWLREWSDPKGHPCRFAAFQHVVGFNTISQYSAKEFL